MKTLKTRLGMLLRMSAAATLLISGQQAMADGTEAGLEITNTVLVDYDVNSVAQDQIVQAGDSFTVDRRVTFTLQRLDDVNTDIAPAEQNAVTLFRLDNTSNAPLDFSLSAANLPDGDNLGNGTVDNSQMGATFEFLVANGDGAAGVPETGDLAWVDNLAADASVIIAVLSDAPGTLTDGDVAHIELTATAADGGTTSGPLAGFGAGTLEADLVASTSNDPNAIDTVFGDAGNDGLEAAADGYTVVSAALDVDKDVSIIFDPISPGPTYYAIPDAVVQYEIVFTNNGTVSADDVEIEDTLVGELIFYTATPVQADIPTLPADWSGNVQIEENGTITYCTAENDTDTNTDGCVFNTGTSTLTIDGRDGSGSTQVPINVGTTDPVTVRFLATIDPS